MADSKTTKEQSVLLEEQAALLEKIKSLYSDVSTIGEAINKVSEERNKLNDLLISSSGESKVLDAQKIKDLQTHIQMQKNALTLQIALGAENKKQLQEQLRGLEDQEKKVNLLSEEEKIVKENLKTALGIRNTNDTIFGRIKEIQQIGKLSLSDEKERAELQKQFFQSKAQDFIEKIVQLTQVMFTKALELDNSMRGLMRDAGFSYEDARRGIINSQMAMAGAAVSTEALAKSMVSLRTSFSAYTSLTGTEKTKVDAMVATLDKMGVSADVSAKFLDTATKSLGMSLTQSSNFLSSLKGFSDQSGISLQILSKDLSATASEITKFGKEGITVFKEMAIASKNLGIEMSKLFQVTEQFTTFEGAALAAGKFNALLGGDFINSVDLMTVSMENPVDAFRIFKEAMDQSGKSFDEMDVGMRRVMASAIGMGVEEAGKAFSQDINTATQAMREQAATQEKLNELSGKMSNFTDKLQTAFVALYPALLPIIDALSVVGDKLVEFFTWIGKYAAESENFKTALYVVGFAIASIGATIIAVTTVLLPLIATVTSVKILFGGLGPILKFAFSPFTGLAAKLKGVTSSLGGMAATGPTAGAGAASAGAGAETGGRAAGLGAKGFLAAGAAILMIGAGIAIAAYGLSFLAASFSGLGDAAWPAAAAIIGFTVAFGVLMFALSSLTAGPQAAVTYAAVGVLLSIGAAAVMIGKGISLAAQGFASYNESQAKLLEVGSATVETMNSLSDATINRYKELVTVFSEIATQLENISDTGVLDKLNSNAFSVVVEKILGTTTKVQGPSTGIEFNVGGQSNFGNTSLQKEEQQIVVNVKIDSPVQIDGRKIGDFIAENKSVITAVNKALDQARRA